MNKHNRRTVLAAAVASAIALAGCGGGTSPSASAGTDGAADAAALTLGLVQGQDFVHAMPARVAEAQGLFTKQGLDVKIVGFSSGSDLTKAMAGGSVQAAAATGLDAVAASAKGVPLQAFFGVMAKSPMALMVPEGSAISGFDSLKGRKVAISKIGSLTDYTLRAALNKVSIPLGAVKEVPLGDPASTMAGMERGDVDAFILPINFGFILQAKGTGTVAEPVANVLGDNDQFAILMAGQDFAASNASTLKKLASAYTEAITWMQANKDGTIALAENQLKMTPEIATKTYDALVPAMTPDGSLHAAGLAAYAQALPELGIAKDVPDSTTYLNTSVVGS